MRGVVRLVTVLAAMSMGGGAQAQQARPGQYGGGLLEFLATGHAAAPGRPAVTHVALDSRARPQRRTVAALGPQLSAADPMAGAEPAPRRVQVAMLPQQPGPQDGMIARTLDPSYQRQVVPFAGSQRPGTIVIDTASRHLYLVQPGGEAIRYGIGVGRPGFLWRGVKTVSQKREWPDWTPPAEMLRRRPDLPRHMEGGPDNPLGARALYLGSSLYRIHGTNEPHTIGQAVSSGCIRMMNEDVVDLYARIPVGARVEVI